MKLCRIVQVEVNNNGALHYWWLKISQSQPEHDVLQHTFDIPANVIASPLTCTSCMDPSNDGDGAARFLVSFCMSSPGGTPPIYQLPYNCIPFNFPCTSRLSSTPLSTWRVPKGGSEVITYLKSMTFWLLGNHKALLLHTIDEFQATVWNAFQNNGFWELN